MEISGIHAIPMIITCLLQGILCDTGIPCTFYEGNICSVHVLPLRPALTFMRFNLVFSSYLCLLGDLCLASLSTKLGKTINFTNNIMTRKKTTPMGGAVMDQNPHQLRKKITFGPNTVQLIILFVPSNHQTTNLVFTNFFHEFFSVVAGKKRK